MSEENIMPANSNTSINDAIEDGDLDLAKKLLDDGAPFQLSLEGVSRLKWLPGGTFFLKQHLNTLDKNALTQFFSFVAQELPRYPSLKLYMLENMQRIDFNKKENDHNLFEKLLLINLNPSALLMIIRSPSFHIQEQPNALKLACNVANQAVVLELADAYSRHQMLQSEDIKQIREKFGVEVCNTVYKTDQSTMKSTMISEKDAPSKTSAINTKSISLAFQRIIHQLGFGTFRDQPVKKQNDVRQTKVRQTKEDSCDVKINSLIS